MRRQPGVEPTDPLGAEPQPQRVGERQLREMRAARDALEPRREPLLKVGEERSVREVRPIPGTRQLQPSGQRGTGTERAGLVRPGQCVQAHLTQAVEHRRERGVGWDARQRLLGDDQRVEPFDLAGDHRLVARRPLDLDGTTQTPARDLFQRRAVERGGEQDARLAIAVIEVERDDELAAGEPVGVREHRAAAVGEQVARRGAVAASADAVGVGAGEQACGADRCRVRTLVVRRLPCEELRGAPQPRQRAAVEARLAPGIAAAAEHEIEPRRDIGGALPARPPAAAAQQVAFTEQGGETGARAALAAAPRLAQQMREPRMRRQPCELAAVRGDPPRLVERPEPLQQIARALQHRHRRRIQPRQRGGVGRAPLGEVERERREVGFEDLGRRLRGEAALRTLAP